MCGSIFVYYAVVQVYLIVHRRKVFAKSRAETNTCLHPLNCFSRAFMTHVSFILERGQVQCQWSIVQTGRSETLEFQYALLITTRLSD